MKFAVRCLVVLLLLSVTFGCAGGRHSKKGRPNLSEAMEKSANSYPGERTITTSRGKTSNGYPGKRDRPKSIDEVLWPLNLLFSVADSLAETPTVPEPKKIDTDDEIVSPTFSFGGSVGYAFVDASDIYRLYRNEVFMGITKEKRSWTEVFFGAAFVDIDGDSKLDDSLKDVWLLDLGYRYKLYITPLDRHDGVYLLGGFGFDYLMFSYNNSIMVDGESIGRDELFGAEIMAGIGVSFIQTEKYRVGFEIVPSYIFWADTTSKGFENDVFDDSFMLKLRLTFNF